MKQGCVQPAAKISPIFLRNINVGRLAVWQSDLQVVSTGAPRTKTSEYAKLPPTTLAVDNLPRARPVGPTNRPRILEIGSKTAKSMETSLEER